MQMVWLLMVTFEAFDGVAPSSPGRARRTNRVSEAEWEVIAAELEVPEEPMSPSRRSHVWDGSSDASSSASTVSSDSEAADARSGRRSRALCINSDIHTERECSTDREEMHAWVDHNRHIFTRSPPGSARSAEIDLPAYIKDRVRRGPFGHPIHRALHASKEHSAPPSPLVQGSLEPRPVLVNRLYIPEQQRCRPDEIYNKGWHRDANGDPVTTSPLAGFRSYAVGDRVRVLSRGGHLGIGQYFTDCRVEGFAHDGLGDCICIRYGPQGHLTKKISVQDAARTPYGFADRREEARPECVLWPMLETPDNESNILYHTNVMDDADMLEQESQVAMTEDYEGRATRAYVLDHIPHRDEYDYGLETLATDPTYDHLARVLCAWMHPFGKSVKTDTQVHWGARCGGAQYWPNPADARKPIASRWLPKQILQTQGTMLFELPLLTEQERYDAERLLSFWLQSDQVTLEPRFTAHTDTASFKEYLQSQGRPRGFTSDSPSLKPVMLFDIDQSPSLNALNLDL